MVKKWQIAEMYHSMFITHETNAFFVSKPVFFTDVEESHQALM
jgi:hypothetical protein